ncbi:APC family permease [Patulibacter minatonensis]|uniref:APC family permease n=1 Tax=Patulibacter minatonensis TaxID=298163 RepID=UPI0004BB5579|nr:APC family permease [Patulibacter minatonensis]
MAERRLHGLQRVLGTNALFSTAYGNVGSSIYYALGLVAGFALGLTPVVFIITGVIFYLTAATYAEATSMYPEAGGSSSFARRAFNEFWSFFAAWGQMLNYTITIAISSYFVPHYIGGLWEPLDFLRHAPGDIGFALVVIALLATINIVGAKESAGVNIALAVTDFLTQVLLVGLGMFLVFSPDTLIDNVHLGVAPQWKDFLIAIPIGMVAYTGIETISNMAEEAKDAGTTVPAAIKRVVIAVFAIYAFLPMVALSALPVTKGADGTYTTQLGLPEDQGGFAGDPILGVVKNMDLGFLQQPTQIYVGLLAATILFLATNAGVIGVSRLVYSMGIHRQMPDGLRTLHPKFGTPWVGILVFSALAALAVIPGQAEFLSNMYAFGAMLSFTIAHVSVIALRRREPDFDRPYRGPGNVTFGGVSYPLFAIVGGLGTGIAFIVVVGLHPAVALAGVGWMAAGLVIYPLYRRNQGLDLRTTHKIATPEAVVDHEAEYESVIVALLGLRYSHAAMATAARVASVRRRGIYLMVPIVVPQSSPIDAPMKEQERAAEALIEEARLQIGNRLQARWVKVRAGQFGRVVVEDAKITKARAIVMSIPPRAGSGSIYRSIDTVMAERPCRVILQSDPQAQTVKQLHEDQRQGART